MRRVMVTVPWIRSMECDGYEDSLEECTAAAWRPSHECKHLEDVGVECVPFMEDGGDSVDDPRNPFSEISGREPL